MDGVLEEPSQPIGLTKLHFETPSKRLTPKGDGHEHAEVEEDEFELRRRRFFGL